MTDPQSLSRPGRVVAVWFISAMVPPLLFLACYGWISKPPGDLRLWFDNYDVSVYLNSSRWAVGEGRLYVEVTSEYPPVANLLFGAVRVVADTLRPLPRSLDSFLWVWVTLNWWVYLAVTRFMLVYLPHGLLPLWLNPITLYFALLKFDLYPTACTFLMLHAATRERYLTAAVWLGIAAAVKGYPLFFAPVFAVFVRQRAGFSAAFRGAVLCGAIFAGPLVVVASYAGAGNATVPFRYHAARVLDERAGASVYDVAIHNLGLEFVRAVNQNRVPTLLQLATVALAVSLRPGRGDRMAAAGLLAVMGFVMFSRFFSPQFVIWLVPFAAYANSRAVRLSVYAMLMATYLLFPVTYDLRDLLDPDSHGRPLYFSVAVLTAFSARCLVMISAYSAARDHPVAER